MTAELTEIFKAALLLLLIVAAVAASVMKRVVPAVIVFSSFSLIMALVWMLLEAPDLAITEAAVGAGVSGVLFYMALKRIGEMERERRANSSDENAAGGSDADSDESGDSEK